MKRLGAVLVLAMSATAAADPPGMTPVNADPDDDSPLDPRIVATGSDTARFMVGVGAVMFASYPNGIADPAPTLILERPLWFGERKPHFQWALDATVLAGYGTYSHQVQLSAQPGFGFDLYWGPHVGAEVRCGPAWFGQLGTRTAMGWGFGGSGAFVIRPTSDDRRRIKLWATMSLGYSTEPDPMNDFFGAGAMGVGVGYEAPY